MKFVCGPIGSTRSVDTGSLAVDLYAKPQAKDRANAGDSVMRKIVQDRLRCEPRAWDFLTIALSVITADLATLRINSPDGWTREMDLCIAVADEDFWNLHAKTIAHALAFLTTDIWSLHFVGGGQSAPQPSNVARLSQDCIVLLSGGLDSLVGAIDLAVQDFKPIAVSQLVRGDANSQRSFASTIADGIHHLQFNHTATTPTGSRENSQRARSLIFIALGVLAATTLKNYHEGATVPLYMCENGFIALNPPLTGSRIGSLSTRTAHPEFLGRIQWLLNAADIRVQITNPYVDRTKGEMLAACRDRKLLKYLAAQSISCARYLRYSYHHCGRCVPCQIRRAAFLKWGVLDRTDYVYSQIGLADSNNAGFDDVRSVAMALAMINRNGIEGWLRGTLATPDIPDRELLSSMVKRAMGELENLHKEYGVR